MTYNEIVPLIGARKHDTKFRYEFMMALRKIVGNRMPKNKVGAAIMSDFDLFEASPDEMKEAYEYACRNTA